MITPTALRYKLVKIFKKYGIIAAYLFGSHARGTKHAGSDTDIAVRFSRDLPLKKTLLLINELTPLFSGRIDLLNLASAPLPLQFRVYKERKLLYALNPKQEVLKRANALSLYHDYKYYFDRFTRFEVKRILAEGLA